MKTKFTNEEKFKIANALGYSYEESIKLTDAQIQNILDFGETSVENELANQIAYEQSGDDYEDRKNWDESMPLNLNETE